MQCTNRIDWLAVAKWNLVEKFAPNSTDQALTEWVRHGRVRHRLDLGIIQHTEIRLT